MGADGKEGDSTSLINQLDLVVKALDLVVKALCGAVLLQQ
jgi:hypothetical protein